MGVMRLIATGASFLAVCVSGYSLWLSWCQNRKLFLRNRELIIENARLREQRDAFVQKVAELKERLHDGEEN